MKKVYKPYAGCALAGVLALLAACGGGGGGSTAGGGTGGGGGGSGGGGGNPPPSTDLVTSVPDPTYDSENLAVFRQLNLDRAGCGFGMVKQDTRLDAAAAGHANYIKQNLSYTSGHTQTPGNPGYTGTTPWDRISATGYAYYWASEGIAFSGWGEPQGSNPGNPFTNITPSPKQGLRVLYASVYHLRTLMSGYRDIGFAYADRINTSGAGWLGIRTLVMDYAIPSGSVFQEIPSTSLAAYPCGGTANVQPIFGGEEPDPFPNTPKGSSPWRGTSDPYGQPLYFKAATGATLTYTSSILTPAGGGVVNTTVLDASNDPQGKLGRNEFFIVPTARLQDNTRYDVTVSGTNSLFAGGSGTVALGTGSCNYVTSGAFTCTYSFTTGTFYSD